MAPARAAEPKAPQTLRIGHATFKVFCDDETDELLDDRDVAGLSNGDVLKIMYRSNRPHTTRAETLLHEVLHMCLFAAGVEMANDIEERVVRSMSMVLFGTLRDNPKLVEFLLHKE